MSPRQKTRRLSGTVACAALHRVAVPADADQTWRESTAVATTVYHPLTYTVKPFTIVLYSIVLGETRYSPIRFPEYTLVPLKLSSSSSLRLCLNAGSSSLLASSPHSEIFTREPPVGRPRGDGIRCQLLHRSRPMGGVRSAVDRRLFGVRGSRFKVGSWFIPGSSPGEASARPQDCH
ncbi:uncharacterized protein BP01DRAFT_26902 [Aspergillus saccharolyticus JOP 1030-1]|uniref:Uncharacterized protein n=1 Tax=Aspergillus saccharolyticus JOP 1030-1 TaxID=1450539 RepID=A0A318ZFD1_9EURO|nr:hypothetical protein BP01DRAFT_26902 [Aspergillus saccharolyticus JOP 1030-1]PYH46251.1 hypothetical protein BP01DRAFT_26902 [Aspergillus saccharolyticus JOP 1030-1]